MGGNVLITGAAGYIGSMLADELARLEGVRRIVGIDLKPRPKALAQHHKLRWIQADVADGGWIPQVAAEQVEVVVHCAYQIRQLYGRAGNETRGSNLAGAENVFQFARGEPAVRRLIQLSTVSAYGAIPSNSVEHRLTENSPLNETEYAYAADKAKIEALLRQLCECNSASKHVVTLRLASVAGPHGRFDHGRYGLVSTMAGRFPVLICGRSDWGRQYLHEDDAVAIIRMLALWPRTSGFEVFNATPRDYLTASDLACVFRKRLVLVPPVLLRTLFALLWHGTRGRISTSRGAWKFLSFPINVDGSQLTERYGYVYRYSSLEALCAKAGRYASQQATGSAGPDEPPPASTPRAGTPDTPAARNTRP